MRLTFEQIKEITVGSVKTEVIDGGIHFNKCSDRQIAAWYDQKEPLGDRSRATTGIRLDFHTNSQSLSFRALDGRNYELFIDNLLNKKFSLNNGDTAFAELRAPLGEKKEQYHVSLVLPCHSPAVLEYVEVDDNAFVRPHRFDCKMLFIGDSITQGCAAIYDGYSFAYRVSRFFNANSVIQGIGGAYFHENCFDSIDFDPDYVFVAYGTNDFGHYHTYEEFCKHAEAHLALIAKEYSNKKIFVISPIWRGKRDGKAMGTFEGCRRIVIDIAKKFGMIHIDGLSLVPPIPDMFIEDCLHPNDMGFSLYAENLIRELLRYIPLNTL